MFKTEAVGHEPTIQLGENEFQLALRFVAAQMELDRWAVQQYPENKSFQRSLRFWINIYLELFSHNTYSNERSQQILTWAAIQYSVEKAAEKNNTSKLQKNTP
jgi:hypothetical protein